MEDHAFLINIQRVLMENRKLLPQVSTDKNSRLILTLVSTVIEVVFAKSAKQYSLHQQSLSEY